MKILSLLALALAPGTAIILYIYLKDKHEREPLWLLVVSFLYGAMSTLLTFFLSWTIEVLVFIRQDDALQQFFTAFFKVALIEEFSKFVFVRFVLYYNRNFNEPFDGIVYSVMVSMGFATLENVIYVYNYGFVTGLMRMFTAVPAHAVFGILMGFFLGKAKFIHDKQIYYSIVALLMATIFHGAYDYFWFAAELENAWTGIWIGAIMSLVIGFILSRKAIRLHQQASPFLHADDKDDGIV
jgi:RsiW-degrading membrane proteinase PrsW (M82 family)